MDLFGDLDDDLLALAEGTSTKRKSKSSQSQRSKPKRKRPTHEDSGSDMDVSSDSDAPPKKSRRNSDDDASDDDNTGAQQYPLEGKYTDEADRSRILAMPQLEREGILAERAEKLNAETQRRDLRRMVKAKERAEGGGGGGYDDDDDGLRTGRERKATGVTREKREGLEKLKKRREEKGKQKDRKYDDEPSSPRRRRDSPDDAYSEDSRSDDERVQVSEKLAPKSAKRNLGADVAGPADLKGVTVTRTKLIEFCGAPWFENWVKDSWVRYLVGEAKGENQYRLCQVISVQDLPDRPYRFENNVKSSLQLQLKHGDAERFFPITGVSDAPPTDKEFARLSQTLQANGMALPLLKDIGRVRENLERRKEYTMTEADLSAALAKKGVNPSQGKARLLIQRDFARQNGDDALLAEINVQLAKLEAPPSPIRSVESEAARIQKLNERNRQSNREDIKKAETRGQDERRRQAAALARGDSGVKVDPSARVKTLTRLTYDRDPTSRPSTPTPGTPSSGIATPPTGEAKHKPTKIEEVAKGVTIDLDDLDF